MNVSESFLGPGLRRTPPQGRQSHHTSREYLQSAAPALPSNGVRALIKKNDAEKAAKGFGCWTQLVSMLFCQLAHAGCPPRDLQRPGLLPEPNWVHLPVAESSNKSTLSYANEHRPAQLYEDLFYTALNRFRDEEGLGQRKKKFRLKNKLLSLDSTTISLCLKLFPWAKFRRAKGGVQGTSCWTGEFTALRADHQGQTQRCQSSRCLHAQPRLHRGHGSRV